MMNLKPRFADRRIMKGGHRLNTVINNSSPTSHAVSFILLLLCTLVVWKTTSPPSDIGSSVFAIKESSGTKPQDTIPHRQTSTVASSETPATATSTTTTTRPDQDSTTTTSQEGSLSNRRFVVFCGTRPEIVKTAPLIQALRAAQWNTHVVFTGQHPDIAQPFRAFFDIHFDTVVDGIFEPRQSLASLTGKLITKVEQQIPPRPGDVWIVQGDTSTAFGVGTVAFLRQIPLVHLEAGLRTFHHHAPYPEEFHRRALSLAASLHISPTELATQRLLSQGVDPRRIFTLGNTGMDATRLAEPQAKPNDELQKIIQETSTTDGTNKVPLVLVTLHRRENANMMDDYYKAMGESPCRQTFVVPVHPNPTATKAARNACQTFPQRFRCVSPLGYGETQWMLSQSDFVITDSGGLQEESTWYSRPVLVVRQDTERSEGIAAGVSQLAPNPESLRTHLQQMCGGSSTMEAMRAKVYPFGHGNTSEAVLDLFRDEKVLQLLEEPIVFKDMNVLNPQPSLKKA